MKLVIGTTEGDAYFDLVDTVPGVEVVRATSAAEAIPHIADADAYYGIPSNDLLAAAANLKWIQTSSTGVDFLRRMPALVERDIVVTNARGAHAPSVSEHSLALLLAMTRAIPLSIRWQGEKFWGRDAGYRIPRELMGETLGVIGYGEIGQQVALLGHAFGMEVLALGGLTYVAMVPCLVAAVAGNLTVQELGIAHAEYAIAAPIPDPGLATILRVALAAAAFGVASAGFSELVTLVERESKALVADPVWRTALGGVAVVLVTLLLGTRAYNGLSLPLIAGSLDGSGVPTFAFLFKAVLTALTLGVGFKGGEVTPLFVVGATLGATLGGPLGEPPAFLAALGFVAVFSSAANTPLAGIVMGVELFGGAAAGPAALFFGIAVIVAYTVSGHRGIYHAQRVLAPKFPGAPAPDPAARLGELGPARTAWASRLAARWPANAPQPHPDDSRRAAPSDPSQPDA